MGKKAFRKKFRSAHRKVMINRSDLIYIVEQSIKLSSLHKLNPQLADELRDVAKNSNSVAYNCWIAKSSKDNNPNLCGCPLTQTGMCIPSESNQEQDYISLEDGGSFPSPFDFRMSRQCGTTGPTIAMVVD